MAHVTIQPDFSRNSVNPYRCWISNHTKRKDETGVFRLGNITDERGWLEVSFGAIGELAMSLGWISTEQHERQAAEIQLLKRKLAELEKQVDQSKIDTVIEISTKLESERRKTRRYKARIDELEGKEAS